MKQFFSILFTFSFFIIKAQTITIWQGPSTGGGWSNAANWSNGVIPPANLTGNAEIIIDPVIGGTCILDIEQRISNSSKLTVKWKTILWTA